MSKTKSQWENVRINLKFLTAITWSHLEPVNNAESGVEWIRIRNTGGVRLSPSITTGSYITKSHLQFEFT